MESLGIDIKLLVAQIVNFVLFYVVFKRYIAKPFAQFFNLEVEKEKEKERVLEKLKKQEEELITKEKIMKQNIKKEADNVLKEARSTGDELKKEIISNSKLEAEEIVKRGRRQIEEEKKVMLDDLNEKAVKIALASVEKGLRQFLSQDMQKSITNNILKNFSAKK